MSTGDPTLSVEGQREGVNHYKICGTNFLLETQYIPQKAIGTGAYGIVCSAKRQMATGETRNVAIKKIANAYHNVEDAKRLLREIKLLKHFRHENVVQIQDIMRPRTYEQFDDVYIVSELMDTDLGQIIRSDQPLTDEHIQYFVYQILRSLRYIHSANVIHRDLKPSNILINSNCDAKICDFGLARPLSGPFERGDNHMTLYVTTRWYRAPEVLLCDLYAKPIDIWSTGCILAELLGRKPIFPGKNHWLQLPMIVSIMGSPSDADIDSLENPKAKAYLKQLPPMPRIPFQRLFPAANPLALDLLGRMLQFDPRNRCTVEQALAHPYLASLHDPLDEPVCPTPFAFGVSLEGVVPGMIKDMVYREMMDFHPDHFAELDAIRVQGVARSLPTYVPPPAVLHPIPSYSGALIGGAPAVACGCDTASSQGDAMMTDEFRLLPEEEFEAPPPGTPMTDI